MADGTAKPIGYGAGEPSAYPCPANVQDITHAYGLTDLRGRPDRQIGPAPIGQRRERQPASL